MILADQSALVLENAQPGHEGKERPKRPNGLDRIVWAIAPNMGRKSAPQLLSLLVKLLVPVQRGQMNTFYSITGQAPSLACGTIIPNAASKSGLGANTGWGNFKAAIEREEGLPGKPRLRVPGIRSHVLVPRHSGQTCNGSIGFASLHVDECGQEEVLWPSKSLSTYLRAS